MNFSSDLLNLNSKIPGFSIIIEGKDVTTVLDARLMSLTLTDNRGFEADQLDLELDDSDGQIVLPRRGLLFSLRWGGKVSRFFRKGPLQSMRLSTAERLTVHIRARSADFRETLNTRREKSGTRQRWAKS